jgi:hypothetical protein
MPGLRTALVPFALDITISGENLLAWPNYAAVGAITGSAFFGLPYAAHAGRTLRASVRLTR